VIVGFPGETDHDVQTLADFLQAARLDAVGVFGYSDESDTEAAGMTGKISEDEIEARRASIADLADELVVQRAEDRIGEPVRVLIEAVEDGELVGRGEHQGPEVDGTTRLPADDPAAGGSDPVGRLIDAVITDADGVDLIAACRPVVQR
jgi:tRNA A37 methylthiotransferase MiaB